MLADRGSRGLAALALATVRLQFAPPLTESFRSGLGSQGALQGCYSKLLYRLASEPVENPFRKVPY